MAHNSGLSAWSRAVPKLRLWTYRSIRILSQHTDVVRLPNKLEVNWATEPQLALPPRRFEAFPNMLAVNPAVHLYSRVLTSKTYGGILGHCNYPVFYETPNPIRTKKQLFTKKTAIKKTAPGFTTNLLGGKLALHRLQRHQFFQRLAHYARRILDVVHRRVAVEQRRRAVVVTVEVG